MKEKMVQPIIKAVELLMKPYEEVFLIDANKNGIQRHFLETMEGGNDGKYNN